MTAALEPGILILCPLAREWSFLVKTFEASRHVELLHDLKIEAVYIPDWRALVAPGGHGPSIDALCRSAQAVGGFHVAFDVIASGDEDVVTAKRAQEICDQTGAACVAWEGSGAARAAQGHRQDRPHPHAGRHADHLGPGMVRLRRHAQR